MDALKVSTNQINRGVNSNQRAEKQRDEGFVASSLVENKEKQKTNAAKHEHANVKQTITEDRSAILVEQRKQEMAQQLAEKEKANQQLDKAQELSLQRQIEERAAVNKQKLKGSYAAVQQSDNQKQAQEASTEQKQEPYSEQEHTQEAINLVV